MIQKGTHAGHWIVLENRVNSAEVTVAYPPGLLVGPRYRSKTMVVGVELLPPSYNVPELPHVFDVQYVRNRHPAQVIRVNRNLVLSMSGSTTAFW